MNVRAGCLAAMLVLAGSAGADVVPLESWQQVVRQTPYWESQGVHANLATIRRWVLAGEGYCHDKDRHVLFDRRMRFIGYVGDVGGRAANQAELNAQRRRLAEEGKVAGWVPGSHGRLGYPFVLSCDQPDAQLAQSLARYAGEDSGARLWGTWDGMRVGSETEQVSLHQAIRHVYEYRREQGRVALPEHVLSMLAGKVIIESGGLKRAHSPAGAVGIMQLSAGALSDCRIDERFHLHRLAQIDCALYLLEQNHRNLAPVFVERFGHLPEEKAELLYRLLLVQTYHSGVGRVIALLTDEVLSRPARYFAEHHEPFTAGDIALGLVFHNLGRRRLGFASLYYVTDVSIASDAACARLEDLAGCE